MRVFGCGLRRWTGMDIIGLEVHRVRVGLMDGWIGMWGGVVVDERDL